jgi:hypothetical protein
MLLLIIVYYLVRAIKTGNKFDFALAAIFMAGLLLKYFKRKKIIEGNKTNP